MLRLQCFMAFSVLSDKTSLNSLACNTRTFGKLSLNVRLNIISIFVKNMQNILWGKCQENTIKFLEKNFLTFKIGKLWVLPWEPIMFYTINKCCRCFCTYCCHWLHFYHKKNNRPVLKKQAVIRKTSG